MYFGLVLISRNKWQSVKLKRLQNTLPMPSLIDNNQRHPWTQCQWRPPTQKRNQSDGSEMLTAISSIFFNKDQSSSIKYCQMVRSKSSIKIQHRIRTSFTDYSSVTLVQVKTRLIRDHGNDRLDLLYPYNHKWSQTNEKVANRLGRIEYLISISNHWFTRNCWSSQNQINPRPRKWPASLPLSIEL
jgi:hypothetical protein